ncbi:putative bifunctional diguanylate cyclase/phosphodiesterase [Thalassotalea sediminis]|uniref:putative bifunctional diguanylate cyclase/phosphodiesterase n=1 Tax=Thalassotalea sediminis TaxID=1759089 RepID=UPI0025735252|nr:GGDEF domain-containing phosphodiesterase [Thalassotalea sediminis]
MLQLRVGTGKKPTRLFPQGRLFVVEEKVKSIIDSLSNSKSTNYIDVICLSLASAIKADYVFVASINDEQTEASTISLASQHDILDNFSYELKCTPCEKVSSGGVCSYPSDIQAAYPNDQLLEDMGIEGYVGIPLHDDQETTHSILVALFCSKFNNEREITSLFLLFSGLINKELEKQKVMNELRTRNEIIEKSKEAIIVCDKDNKIISANKAFTDMTGYSFREVAGKNPKILSADKQSDCYYQEMWADIHTKGSWSGELINRKKNGEEFPEWLSINTIHDENNEIVNYVAFFFDISQRKAAEEKIYHQANYDLLTGIPNRYKFLEELTKNINAKAIGTFKSALLVMDLDLFQEVNDVYGHHCGDALLVKVAERLKSLINVDHRLARITGDGFALLLTNVADENDVDDFIARLLIEFSKPFYVEEHIINCTLSVGIVDFDDCQLEASSLMKKAERALSHAKENGRNSSSYFTQEMENVARHQIKMKADLERALKERKLSLMFQPIVSTKSKEITKFEALLRWNHEGKWISPAEFIPLAEECSLIKPLGEYVLAEACLHLKKLKGLGYNNIVFNVNRSVYEIPLNQSENQHWLIMINMYGLKPSDICFELTESALAPDKRNNETLFTQLREAGCKIALDDFGTGYSSLSYIRRIPLDYIKIDKSFISDISENPDDKVLVSTIIAMSKSLGKEVVAEGVETIEQVRWLEEMGCDYIQGFYFSKPLTFDNIPAFIDNFNYEAKPTKSLIMS